MTTSEGTRVCEACGGIFTPPPATGRRRPRRLCDPCRTPEARELRGPRCSVEGCQKAAKAKGVCIGHYAQIYSRGLEPRPLRVRHYAKDGFKFCKLCERTLPVAEFGKKGKYITEHCKPCKNMEVRASAYGVSIEIVKAWMLQSACDVCERPFTGTKDRHIDHCHETGKVRGLLCHNCNLALTTTVTPAVLRRLAEYLEASSC